MGFRDQNNTVAPIDDGGSFDTDTNINSVTSTSEAAASAFAAANSAAAALVSKNTAAADVVLTNADVVLTHDDVILTNADVVLTNADVVLAEADKVQTGLDRIAVAADRVLTDQDTQYTAADVVLTNADVVLTNADVTLTNADVVLAEADKVQTGLDRIATNADVALTNADVILTHADVVLAEADKVQTGLDRVATNADVVLTNADVLLTNADVVLTHADVILAEADKVQTGLDRIATNADVVLTNADVVLVEADKVQTGIDRIATANSASSASTSASTATTKASEASTSATTATTKASEASTSATNASTSASSSASSATAAQTAETNAETAEINASTSATSASNSATAASTSATAAATSATNASTSESSASTSASTATTKASEASTSATNAATSASSASTSASTATTKASEASTSATSASGSASTATTKASEASTSATTAVASKTAAETAETNAETAETNAAASASTATTKASEASTSATNAATSATSAATSATAAQTAETNAETAETNASASSTSASSSASTATTKAGEAATSATSASGSASTATTKASEASTSATSASGSATTATTKASEASTSATNAATFATSASSSASTATTKASEASASATNAATSASTATTKASEASTSATNAATSASASASSATAAQTAETNAETAETNAASSATTASTKAGESLTSANSSATSATAATAAKDAALAALDSFDDRYLGAKASDPTVDNDGNALVSGALYFNTTDDVMRVYTGSAWVAAYASLSGALLATNNLSDIDNAVSSRLNLGLVIGTNVQAFSSILAATTASYTTALNTKLSGIETGATADQTAAQIKTAYEGNANTNEFSDAEQTKLSGIEASATADQTGAQIKTAYEAQANAFTDAQFTKLGGIEALADVTDTANVTAAGALMDSEVDADIKTLALPANTTISTFGASLVDDLTSAAARTTLGLGTAATTAATAYATAAQGTTADAALPKIGGALTGAVTTSSTFDGRNVSVDGSKLDGIEAGATADQTGAQIKTAYEAQANAFTDTQFTKLSGIETGANVTDTANVVASLTAGANITIAADGTITGSDSFSLPTASTTTLGGVKVGTNLSISGTGVLSSANTTYSVGDGGLTQINFTSSDNTKLDGIETGATADQTNAEIRAAVEAATDSNVFTDADHTKLNAIEALADVTDATNVTASGALMDSEVTNLAQVKSFSAADYATAAQGTLATNALPKAGGVLTGAVTTNSTFDGVDIAVRDGILTTTTTTANAALPKAGGTMTGNIVMPALGTVDGRDLSVDGAKLDLIEAGATADQTGAQIKTAYEAEANAFTNAQFTKLGGIETGATADQTAAEIRAAVEAAINSNVFTDADHTKLNAIEASADVTDATNVTAAGALMDSEVTNLAQVKAFSSADYATAAQGTLATNALPKAGGAMTGAITTNSTFDGRDVSVDGTKLDGIETGATADQTAAQLLTAVKTVDGTTSGLDADLLDGQEGSYYTGYTDTAVANLVDSSPAALNTLNELAAALGDDANFATTTATALGEKLPKAGGTMTGNIVMPALGTVDGRDLSVDGAKLDGIEAGATTDQTAAQILTAIKTVDGAGSGLDADLLDGLSSASFATSAQGTLATNALPKVGGALTGAVTTSSTFDGRDVSVDGAKLDGIAAGATNTVGNATHTGEVTGSGALTIASNVVDADNLKVTGNGTTSQYLRSDGDGTFTWATPPNTTYSVGDGGLTQINFTSADNTKLDGIAASANNYSLPLATDTARGGIELFSNTDQTVAPNAVTATASRTYGLQLNAANQAMVNVPWVNTTYSVGDGGLSQINFTSADHTKLNGIETGATTDQTAAQILTAIKTVDGAGSGLDADLLDGQSSAYFGTATAVATNTAKVTNATHTGEVTGSGALTIANNVVDAGNLKVTGNGTTSQYLRSDGDGTFTWATPPNTTYSVGDGGLSQINFTSADNTKLDGIATGATNTVGNATHTGEVTGSGALTIASNVVDEANLKVSNAPTNGYMLTAQSGNTGGLTWAEAGGGSTTYAAVGTYGYFITTGTVSSITAGSTTRSGSLLRPHAVTVYNLSASYTGNHHWPLPGSSPNVGTWKAMGGMAGTWAGGSKYTATLWVRIS